VITNTSRVKVQFCPSLLGSHVKRTGDATGRRRKVTNLLTANNVTAASSIIAHGHVPVSKQERWIQPPPDY
jgi:hypothetical protein